MYTPPQFKVGDRLTEENRSSIVCTSTVVKAFKHFVRLNNGKEWKHNGYPKGHNPSGYYLGPTVRLFQLDDLDKLKRQRAKYYIQNIEEAQLDKLCTEDLEVVVNILKKHLDRKNA